MPMATASNKIVLFSYWQSSCAWRVRIALAWKRVAYECKPINIVKTDGEQFSDEYTKLNPNQRVPALVIDGHVLGQSGAIIEYLEETRPERPLLPRDPFLRAQVRNICLLIGADIQPLHGVRVLNTVVNDVPETERNEKKKAWAKLWVERGLVALENELASSAGTFCVGNDVTLADVFLEPQVYNAHRFGVDMAAFPIISRISALLAVMPEFEISHPVNQPDAI